MPRSAQVQVFSHAENIPGSHTFLVLEPRGVHALRKRRAEKAKLKSSENPRVKRGLSPASTRLNNGRPAEHVACHPIAVQQGVYALPNVAAATAEVIRVQACIRRDGRVLPRAQLLHKLASAPLPAPACLLRIPAPFPGCREPSS
jgi:hypothetical protein